MNQYTNDKQRENIFIQRLKEKHPTFEYVNGYTNSYSCVNIKCKRCGTIKHINAQCIRGKNNIVCLECNKNKTITNKLLTQQQKYLKEIKMQQKKELIEIYKQFKRETTYIVKCECCNEEMLIRNKSKKLCYRCNRKKRKHSYKSLKKLYKRDKGICYICGNKCDYNDYTYKGNTFIAGNYYPSIEHIIPLIKGGTDEWSNIKLAHRICNSMKKDKVVEEG